MQGNHMVLCLGDVSVQLLDGVRQRRLSLSSAFLHTRIKKTVKHQTDTSHQIIDQTAT
jgi:hypothetical protein